MNRARRNYISKIQEKLRTIAKDIECIRNNEQEALDSIPENLSHLELCDSMVDAIDYLSLALDDVNDAIEELEDAREA